LQSLPLTHFFRDERRGRVGILTTLPIKHAMCTLTNAMLREGRICCTSGENFISKNCKVNYLIDFALDNIAKKLIFCFDFVKKRKKKSKHF
jgi:hypothetical protein